MTSAPSFHVLSGQVIASLLATGHDEVVNVVRDTYRMHGRRETNNPDSYFLRFDDKPNARIIALPAAVRGDSPVSGIKWIASYPDNIRSNLQRASATLLLNDYETGYPVACLEASQISAVRTAASAVLAADLLGGGRPGERRGGRLAVVGAGVIARTILDYFRAQGWRFDSLAVHDLNEADAERLRGFAPSLAGERWVAASLEEAVRGASHVVLATTAATPYIDDATLLHAGQVILNVSLRDLAPELLLTACNVFDDVEHCLKAATSPHLAEQLTGGRDFVAGTLAEVMDGTLVPDRDKPIVFSPFGLGVLDIAVGRHLLARAVAGGHTRRIDDFFPDTARW
ncbi:2,3-diaminopropionate biosynthesis protein SbnB [Azospirillum agricola]|uniref:2,3-diaminopropionate biosynthesis protein SbnB n=1 Tax=Azospirillum agricola TaxID=1720247 RepID=UPI000A0F3FFD|nr:2,3-diaminopropionate biosynthesis protein SbnB [Azospirillum agricola]SMH39467.1 ornithine cyclodeaminase [Azospirillum lipoferum]